MMIIVIEKNEGERKTENTVRQGRMGMSIK
jgi:hypothetical protein